MTIRNTDLNSVRIGTPQQSSVAQVGNVGAVEGGKQAAEQRQTTEAKDRVELSGAAREAYSKSQQQVTDLALAREALNELPELSGGRAGEIRTRLEEGYYTRPEVSAQFAERLAADLL